MCPATKKLYVLGAGSSYEAGVPLQAGILKAVRELDLASLPFAVTGGLESLQSDVIEFIDRVFLTSTPSLEDVFTLLDQAIIQRDSCWGFSWQDLARIRDWLNRAVMLLLHQSVDNMSPDARAFFRGIASIILAERIAPGQKADPVSVISLNWDYVVEDAIYGCIAEAGVRGAVDIDYCCYTSPISASDDHRPSITQKAYGLFNVKVLKPHGSASFLRCPNCSRLFTTLKPGTSAIERYARRITCRHCPSAQGLRDYDGIRADTAPLLEPFFITPTFLKVFDNAHIRTIWHNAHIELSEATEVVFIGYSLPVADYHLRTLFRRAIPRGIPITVVLAAPDDPGSVARLAEYLAPRRYELFFPTNLTTRFDGIRGYFSGSGLGATDISSRMSLIGSARRTVISA
jgi:hypothetical protein